jgi:ABC-type Mn2+/Zn2+ transport system permease subunit
MRETHALALIVAILYALTGSLVGAFAFMRRMLLAADVVSHIALPGLGIALLFHANPTLGAATTLFVGAVLVWHLEQRSDLVADAAIAVVFAASLGIGALITPREELLEALFGGAEELSLRSFVIAIVAIAFILAILFRFRQALLLGAFSRDLAAATGVKTGRLELSFLLIFSLTVLVGLRFAGTLLAGALIILPAAIARQLTARFKSFLVLSALAGAISITLGSAAAKVFRNNSAGPATILIASALFALALLARRSANVRRVIRSNTSAP